MLRRVFLTTVVLGALAACGVAGVSDPRIDVARSYELSGITFATIDNITVSENNGYYPQADIVWRGDPVGDRVAQIGAIFHEAAQRNTGALGGARPVVADIVLVRFHGVTERTRNSVGGVYNIVFNMTVRDAATGEILEPQRRIIANLGAPGGNEALNLIAAGQTERVRVTDYLTIVLRDELR